MKIIDKKTNSIISDTENSKQFASKLMDYILANNLQDYVIEHLYIKNELVSKEAFARSYSVPWLKCYRIEYLVNYYFDDVLLSKKPEHLSYDEHDYLNELDKPVNFNSKQKIIKPMLLLTLQQMNFSALLYIGSKLGLTSSDMSKMVDEAQYDKRNEERINEMNRRVNQINLLRQYMQNIKEGLSMIEASMGRECEKEFTMLGELSEDVEKYISNLEDEIQFEQNLSLSLK